MKIYPFKALIPDKSIIASPASFSSDVKLHYRNYVERGYFHLREEEEMFVYQIQLRDQTYTGFLVLMDTQDVVDNRVLPHENTLHHKEQTSMQTLLEREAMIKPVFLTHPAVRTLTDLSAQVIQQSEPVHTFDYLNNNEKHTLWAIKDDALIKEITHTFQHSLPKVYIADGHHRCRVMTRLYNDSKEKNNLSFNKMVSAFFDFDNLQILDFNRMIYFGDQLTALELLIGLSQICDITLLKKAQKPTSKFEITCYLGGHWFIMKWKKEILETYTGQVILDAEILNDHVLKTLLNIQSVETDQNIKYLAGSLSALEIKNKVDRKSDTVAFCLYPVLMSEMETQAGDGKTLPPKSTYFEPRLPNGFISYHMSGDAPTK